MKNLKLFLSNAGVRVWDHSGIVSDTTTIHHTDGILCVVSNKHFSYVDGAARQYQTCALKTDGPEEILAYLVSSGKKNFSLNKIDIASYMSETMDGIRVRRISFSAW